MPLATANSNCGTVQCPFWSNVRVRVVPVDYDPATPIYVAVRNSLLHTDWRPACGIVPNLAAICSRDPYSQYRAPWPAPSPPSSMYCASTQARTALTYGKEYLQDGTWELEDDEEEAWESGGNGWDVSPTLLVLELPLLAYKGIDYVCCLFGFSDVLLRLYSQDWTYGQECFQDGRRRRRSRWIRRQWLGCKSNITGARVATACL